MTSFERGPQPAHTSSGQLHPAAVFSLRTFTPHFLRNIVYIIGFSQQTGCPPTRTVPFAGIRVGLASYGTTLAVMSFNPYIVVYN